MKSWFHSPEMLCGVLNDDRCVGQCEIFDVKIKEREIYTGGEQNCPKEYSSIDRWVDVAVCCCCCSCAIGDVVPMSHPKLNNRWCHGASARFVDGARESDVYWMWCQ